MATTDNRGGRCDAPALVVGRNGEGQRADSPDVDSLLARRFAAITALSSSSGTGPRPDPTLLDFA